MSDEKREYRIKTTYLDGYVDYSSTPMTKAAAETWAKFQNKYWDNMTHEVVHISEVPKDDES